jgi:PhnB protein
MTYGDMPNPEFPIPDGAKHLVLHSQININGSIVMFADTFPGNPFVVGNNINIVFTGNNIDEIKLIFSKLKEDGTVTMELQETFWSKYYGMLTDKYGVGWQLSYDNGEAGM